MTAAYSLVTLKRDVAARTIYRNPQEYRAQMQRTLRAGAFFPGVQSSTFGSACYSKRAAGFLPQVCRRILDRKNDVGQIKTPGIHIKKRNPVMTLPLSRNPPGNKPGEMESPAIVQKRNPRDAEIQRSRRNPKQQYQAEEVEIREYGPTHI